MSYNPNPSSPAQGPFHCTQELGSRTEAIPLTFRALGSKGEKQHSERKTGTGEYRELLSRIWIPGHWCPDRKRRTESVRLRAALSRLRPGTDADEG
ncbi:hypothetical protein DPEC_G00022700 [Dallia pectoralis]|uniref:Uncharacterized protein n=1 Tax=Dallia pectoralis TaxID=75939 RepID=A0ACC2HGL6_DALPE|nr:hypothetical protein DPEC_G00022700 [Dallia pectoralis]